MLKSNFHKKKHLKGEYIYENIGFGQVCGFFLTKCGMWAHFRFYHRKCQFKFVLAFDKWEFFVEKLAY
jgi:hypothetical protein